MLRPTREQRNPRLQLTPGLLRVVAFAFGLIHGMGFAAVLKDLGLKRDQLALALVGFNLGVEVGQLAIVLMFVPLAYLLRTTRFYRQAFMPGGALTIGLLAAYWLASRSMGYGK